MWYGCNGFTMEILARGSVKLLSILLENNYFKPVKERVAGGRAYLLSIQDPLIYLRLVSNRLQNKELLNGILAIQFLYCKTVHVLVYFLPCLSHIALPIIPPQCHPPPPSPTPLPSSHIPRRGRTLV